MDNLFKSIFRFMKGSRLQYFGAVISVGLATFLSLLTPLIIKAAIDGVLGGDTSDIPPVIGGLMESIAASGQGRSASVLLLFAAVYMGVSLMRGVFFYLKGKWSAMASESLAKRIRDSIYGHIQELPYDYHVTAETGDLIQRATSDVETIRKFLAVQFVEIGRAMFMLGFTLYFMLSLDVMMTIYSMIVVPVIFAFSYLFFTKVKKAFQKSDEAEGRLSNVLQENLSGVRVVRAFGRQKYESDKFEKKNAEYRDLTYRLIKLLAYYWGFSDLLCLLQIGTVLFVGGLAAVHGTLSIGTLVVFVLYEGRLLWPVRQMGRILTDMGKTAVSVKRIMEILDEPEEKDPEGAIEPEISGGIEFRNVHFSYGEGVPVLRGIDLKVAPGQTVAILGATGCGKSSMVHLLSGLYRCTGGSILLDGNDIDTIKRKWLRSHVGLVLQEPFLYSRTIRENIGVVKPGIADADIFEASKDAAIHHVILDFENGYDTDVGEKGVTLSGGQKQRVAIARTLTKDYPVLIFDDSLSAVDTETDAAIRESLKRRNKRATTFIISHRINTLAEADLIIVVEKGRIVQQGDHASLMREEGMYRRIAGLQNEIERDLEAEMSVNRAGVDHE